MIAGDVETAKARLRDFINATYGFGELRQEIRESPKSLMRMLGQKGNPNVGNVCQIIARLQSLEGIQFRLSESYDKETISNAG